MEEYTVLKVLGEGSFGRALLVFHKSSDQKYAMKEIRLPKSPSDVQDSRKEAILLAKMKHPNIVAYKESFEADGHLYIVMEYCDDGDLMQKIKYQRGKLFPEDTILHWFVQMCLGVKHIHDRRVLHRDIKSKNIFLTQNGKVKLGDFGSARLLTNPMAYACTYVGTPYYVPPEIWENLPYNNKSDIWSLGCILYELCTLKHPFQANSWKHLILKICKGSYNPLPSHYSCELHYLIKQMFKRNPKNRPSASTILARGCLAKLIKNCLPPEMTAEFKQILKETKKHKGDLGRKKGAVRTSGHSNNGQYEDQSSTGSNSKLENITKRLSERTLKQKGAGEEENCEVPPKNANLPSPHRKHWERGESNTVVNVLENASLLSSSFTAEEDESGCVIKYSEDKPRKQWLKETPHTLMNILKNADISLAFKTYTIYKPVSEDLLRGPLSEETKVSDEIDGEGEAIIMDPERLEPRSDEEDTDFEEEDDPDWVSELKMMATYSD
ncbi:serine/threonine-protein kinase Nek3-like isoform X1 [Gopherus evgoodei]|uniref:non-specific serine/threonine protein kinase n=1 Tax=Gopherus evgoodei TaxID=1825980 RepID=A0A8C4VS95_9SAUR|nr:serine/threonine-protein kinase Nek3-like isoform X1 [Gopherus evgoodei]XP_030420010.1 serine/threonine-protein kinase Nek3-like isoform X1 [Gopherus evgoodei]XP_030420019.1 serine/threonine-protein kinase Nek3-like isoform X1 [Gopherus evgoodei]XP_030420027.1 serine/threonine-protein kinase Nek3-like isoform X1 [Gopherus evgoodei]